MTPEKAISRFFPTGTSYDKNQADRLIQWLDHCGFEIVPKLNPAAPDDLRRSTPGEPPVQ